MRKYTESIADFDYALSKGGDDATVHYHLALAYWGQKQSDKALHNLHEALLSNPHHADARAVEQSLTRSRPP
jgi:hypothetical protein